MNEERQKQFIKTYTNIALEISNLSRCERKKVGAIIVKDGNILGFGYNGTPIGEDNCCEENGVTKSNVIHAEDNVIRKIKREEGSLEKSSLYVTLTPCENCAKLIIENNIKEVFFLEDYRCNKGVELLLKNNIYVEQVKIENDTLA